MSLFSALNAANSGLKANQAGIDLVAQNVANADTTGYARRRLSTLEAVAGERTAGVRLGAIERALDTVAQRHLRLETSGAAYTALGARFASELDRLFGTPGGAGSLDGAVNNFTRSLQTLAAEPGSLPARGAVLNAGTVLAARIAAIGEAVQSLRSEAEGGLAAGVRRADGLLSGIAGLNGKIAAGPSPALLDERDRLLTELSALMDVQTVKGENGAIGVSTTAGLTLVSGAAAVSLSFDGGGTLGPRNAYSADPALRSAGAILARTIGGTTIDLVAGKLIRSGEIKAQLDQRDTILVEAQRQLDELAAGLSRALSDRAVAGSPIGAGTSAGFDIDLAGLQAGNAITLDYRDNTSTPPGAARRVILVATLGNAPATIDPAELGEPSATVKTVSLAGGMAGLVASIGAALGPGFAVSGTPGAASSVRIQGDGSASAPTIGGVKAAITTTALASGDPALPFFVDTGFGNTPFTGSFEGGSHLTGLAQRLAVNPRLAADSARLVLYATSPATLPGDAARPRFLLEALTGATRGFPAATGIGGGAPHDTTLADYARRVVEHRGASAEAAQRLDEGQQVALASIESRFADSTGVNIDQEMTQLLTLQTAYGANARVITAVRDLLDLLMRM